MEVRAKKALGQHFLVDQGVARKIVAALGTDLRTGNTSTGIPQRDTDGSLAGRVGYDVLEIGPGMGVLTQYLLEREDINLKMVELDEESVNYLLTHFNGMQGRLWQDYMP